MDSPTASADSLCDQARACLKNRDVKGASTYYEQAIEADQRHVAAHEGLATVYFLIHDYDRAAELFLRVTRLDPRRAQPLINLGAVQNKQGEYAAAVKTLRQALAKDRRCAEAYYNLGIAQRGLNQLSMAVSAYKEAIRLEPEMAEAYTNLGNVLIEMGNHTQARLNFERALSIRPDFEKARRGIQVASEKADDVKRSISPFGRLVDMEEVERRNAEGRKQLRHLTPQERYQDRSEVHRLSKEAEQKAAVLLNQIRSELHQSLLELSRTSTESDDPRTWARELDRFEKSFERFQELSSALFSKTDEIRTHEEKVRGE